MSDQELIAKHIKSLSNTPYKNAANALIALGISAVPALLDVVRQGSNETVRWRASEVLGRIGAPSVLGLITLASDKEPLVRRMAIDALGITRDRHAIPVIAAALNDPIEKVRLIAKSALKEFPPAVVAASNPSAVSASEPVPVIVSPSSAPQVVDSGVATPSQESGLAPGRLSDSVRLMLWYFFDPDQLKDHQDRYGVRTSRQLAALPVSLFVWFPLAIPVLAYDVGIITGMASWLVVLLNIAALTGCILTWRIGRERLQNPVGQLQSVGVLILLLASGLVVFHEMRFIYITLSELGGRTGGIIIGIYLISVILGIAVGFDLGVYSPAVVLAVAGAIIGFFIPSELNIQYVPIYFWGLCIALGAGVAVAPAFGLSRLLKKAPPVPTRSFVLLGVLLFNLALFAIMILRGYSLLYRILG